VLYLFINKTTIDVL